MFYDEFDFDFDGDEILGLNIGVKSSFERFEDEVAIEGIWITSKLVKSENLKDLIEYFDPYIIECVMVKAVEIAHDRMRQIKEEQKYA